MLEQKVQNPPLKPLQGIGVVLAALAAAVLGSTLFSALMARVGSIASIGFILYGIATAWLLTYRFVLAFRYQATPDCLRVSRLYGRYARPMVDVWFTSVLAYGAPEEVRARFPSAPVNRATRPHCALETFAMAHTSEGRTVVTLVQPDERLRAHLLGALKK